MNMFQNTIFYFDDLDNLYSYGLVNQKKLATPKFGTVTIAFNHASHIGIYSPHMWILQFLLICSCIHLKSSPHMCNLYSLIPTRIHLKSRLHIACLRIVILYCIFQIYLPGPARQHANISSDFIMIFGI